MQSHKHRIFMIGWEYPPRITGGLGIACRGLARAVAARGHSVDFLLPSAAAAEYVEDGVRIFSPRRALFTADEVKSYYTAIEHFAESGVTVRPYETSLTHQSHAAVLQHEEQAVHTRTEIDDGGSPFLRGGYGDHLYEEIHHFAALAGLLIRKGEYDVVHAHDWMTFPAALAASRAANVPLVCHIHATEFDRSGEHVNQYIYDLERTALHACDRVITVSNYTKHILIERYGVAPEKIAAIHNAVEFSLPPKLTAAAPVPAYPGPGSTVPDDTHVDDRPILEHIVLFLGRITFQKGPDYFVRAARRVVERLGGRGVRFVMVGAGDMYARMIELAADLGVGKYFHYTGFLDHDQVQRIYAMSDLYVMPSVSEPFGISPLEAMVHGVPVIVSKQSGVSEIISNCIKVDFWDVEAIADAIVGVLQDSRGRVQLRANCKAEVRNITWSTAAEKIEAVYDQLNAG